jgi:hypothetical protein
MRTSLIYVAWYVNVLQYDTTPFHVKNTVTDDINEP